MKRLNRVFLAFIVGYPVMVLLGLFIHLILNSLNGIRLGHTSLAFYLIPLEILQAFDPIALKNFLLYANLIDQGIVILIWVITSLIIYKLISKVCGSARRQ